MQISINPNLTLSEWRWHLHSIQFPSSRIDTLISRLRLKSCHNNKANYKRALCIFCEKQTESFRLLLAVGRQFATVVVPCRVFLKWKTKTCRSPDTCVRISMLLWENFRFPLATFPLSPPQPLGRSSVQIFEFWLGSFTVLVPAKKLFCFFFCRLPGAFGKLEHSSVHFGKWNANRFSTPCRLIWGNSSQAKQIFTVYII